MERYIQTHNTNPHFHTSPTLLHYSLNFQPDFPTKQCRRRAKITWIFDRKITFLHACMDFLFIVILVFLGGYLPVSWKLPPSNSGKGANDGLFRDFWLNNGKSTPPWNYRGRTWNWMIGRLSPFLWGQKAYFSGANLRFFFRECRQHPGSDFSIPPDSVPCVAKRLPKAPFGWNRSLPRQRHVLPARVLSCHKLPPLPPERKHERKEGKGAKGVWCVFFCVGGLGRGKRNKKRWVKKSGFTC